MPRTGTNAGSGSYSIAGYRAVQRKRDSSGILDACPGSRPQNPFPRFGATRVQGIETALGNRMIVSVSPYLARGSSNGPRRRGSSITLDPIPEGPSIHFVAGTLAEWNAPRGWLGLGTLMELRSRRALESTACFATGRRDTKRCGQGRPRRLRTNREGIAANSRFQGPVRVRLGALRFRFRPAHRT